MRVIELIDNESKPGLASVAKVEINGVEKELPCSRSRDHWTIYGVAVRYRTGTKVWPGSLIYWPENGRINNVRGPQDHRQSFHSLQVVGFWADVQDRYRSEHNSVVPRGSRGTV